MNELLENAKAFWKSAELVYGTEDHTERFRILQESFPKYYTILDKLFSIYRDTYSLQIDKFKCEEVRKNVTNIFKEQGIELHR